MRYQCGMRNGPYELIVAPKDYPGIKYRGRYAYEHTVVWWKNTGKTPPPGYEIHHVNMRHRDNRFENLQLVTSHEHRLLHGALKRKKPIIRVCSECGCVFSSIQSRKLYCSRRCAGKVNQRVGR